MEVLRINSQTEFNELAKDGCLHFAGSIVINCSIICTSIKAGWSIKAGGYIEAGGYIKAGRYIKAGEYIEAGGYIFSFTYEVSYKALKTKRLPFWREYYAQLPGLEKHAMKIRKACWGELREYFNRPENKKDILAHPWHPIMKKQIENFLNA